MRERFMMRLFFGFMCGCALIVFSMTGCSESTGGEAGSGGVGGTGGGSGGTAGGGGTGGGAGDGGAGGSAWALGEGGAADDLSRGVGAFADNSFLVIGAFQETVIFGADEVHETQLVSSGADDVFLARYDVDGALTWAKQAGGVGQDLASGVAGFSDGSSVISGSFADVATFGPGEDKQTVLTSGGTTDVFVARYGKNGSLAWANRAGGIDSAGSSDLAASTGGSSIVTGYFHGIATFGEGEGTQTQLTSDGLDDIFVARYGADGSLVWAKRAGGELPDAGIHVASFADGSFVLTGRFEGTATFGPGETGEAKLTSAGNRDIFVARYNEDGTLAWATSAGGLESDGPWAITAFTDGSSVVVGAFNDVATFGDGEANETALTSAGGSDTFVARYDNDGALAWAKRAGGAAATVARDVTTMTDNTCVVTGRFEETATFGPGELGETTLTSAGGNDAFIAQYEVTGELRSATSASGTAGGPSGLAIAALPDGSFIVAGMFVETGTFHQGTADETTITGHGDTRDIFVARYKAVE